MLINRRIVAFDTLRLIAIINVIIIHVSYTSFYLINTYPFAWWVTNIFFSLIRWAVPIFFMMTGALLLTKDESIIKIYTKRLPKILLPFIFWNIVYALFEILHNKNLIFYKVLMKALTGPIIYHLWFVYALVGLYLVTPILGPTVRSLKRSVLEYYLILCFFVVSIVPFIEKFYYLKLNIIAPLTDGYVIYFILGYYLFTYQLSYRTKRLIYVSGIISILITIYGTYVLTTTGGKYDDFFHTYLAAPLIATSAAVFIFFLNFKHTFINNFTNLTNKIDLNRICYGIYLSHLVIIGVLSGGKLGFVLNARTINPFLGTVITSTFVFIICFITFYVLELLQKFTFIRLLSRFIY